MSVIFAASTIPTFSYTTAANTAVNSHANDVATRMPVMRLANGVVPLRINNTGDVPPFPLFEPVFIQFGSSAPLVISEWAGRLYIRVTYEPCPTMHVAPTGCRGETTDVVIISVAPRLATHHCVGKRVAKKMFAIITATTEVTHVATTTDISRTLPADR